MDSTITDFLQQVPTGLFIMFCGSGALLVAVIGYFVYARGQRARALVHASYGGAYSDSSSADMPDLDALSTVETFAASNEPPPPSGRTPRRGTYSVLLNDGGSAEVVEVCAILRDVVDGGLIVQMGEKLYRHPPTNADADFKRRYDAVLRGLAGTSAPPPSVAAVPVPTAPAPMSLRDLVTPPTESPSVDASADASADTDAEATDDIEMPSFDDLPRAPLPRSPLNVPMPGDLPKFTLDNASPPPRRGRRSASEPIPEINIAAAIEAYLQFKLQQTGALSGRKVNIRSGLGGAVVIEVDGRFFDSVGDIDDDEVRAFISATIAEWQERQ